MKRATYEDVLNAPQNKIAEILDGMPISTPTDLENLRVSSSPEFQVLIAESRRANPPGTGLSTEEVRRALASRRARRPSR